MVANFAICLEWWPWGIARRDSGLRLQRKMLRMYYNLRDWMYRYLLTKGMESTALEDGNLGSGLMRGYLRHCIDPILIQNPTGTRAHWAKWAYLSKLRRPRGLGQLRLPTYHLTFLDVSKILPSLLKRSTLVYNRYMCKIKPSIILRVRMLRG